MYFRNDLKYLFITMCITLYTVFFLRLEYRKEIWFKYNFQLKLWKSLLNIQIKLKVVKSDKRNTLKRHTNKFFCTQFATIGCENDHCYKARDRYDCCVFKILIICFYVIFST